MGAGHQRQCRRAAKAARRPTNPVGGRCRRAAVERLGELLDSDDERVQLEAAKAILDRHLGRPAIQADITVRGSASVDHLQALVELARKRRGEPIMLGEGAVIDITPSGSSARMIAALW